MQSVPGRLRSSRIVRLVPAVISTILSLALTGAASAKPEYSGKLQENLDLPCAPTCMICHTDPAGGAEHRNQYWLNFYPALNSTVPVTLLGDADKDGKSDGDELKAGENPVIYGNAPVCIPDYGCGARVAATPPDNGVAPEVWLVGAISLGALARFQLRRKRAQSSGEGP